ncbi:Ig-like domain-containing protein [Cohnella hashimotonis]|uniref:Ig-like domain-containing protein n=1 Tax=Cohnella hashimotonis TaxID=2826895 RepID=A0ABT6TNG7_9BACL|nr:Ig-like domain-containing protein [Cohnella hashimotonis]MDI4647382.1 Ig-like domain-containing protein [Cohnella hashimotonis]
MHRFGHARHTLGVTAALVVLLLLAACGASGREQALKFSEVSLSSEPSPPAAGQETKLIATVDNAKYAALEGEVQFQINSKNELPSLIDAVSEGDAYAASYKFPSAGEYTITIHMSYEDEHFAFTRQLQVNE